MNKILVFIPTYEEVKNVEVMCQKIMALPQPLDLLFMDDRSPDGTGQELDRLASLHPRMTVIHRSGKLGIGTAHQEGIAYAYKSGYDILVTLDCDFTHDPNKIPNLLEAREGFQVVLGSRYLEQNSLPGWSIFRKLLTAFGHFLTLNLLGMKYDATGAFRLYDLRTIPAGIFAKVRSKSYSFFFESLFVLNSNKIRIREIPIILPSRAAGHSKLSFFEAYRSTMFLFGLTAERMINPSRFWVDRETDLQNRD